MASVLVICRSLRKAPRNAALARGCGRRLLTGQPTIDMVKQQLAGFAKFIERHGGKS